MRLQVSRSLLLLLLLGLAGCNTVSGLGDDLKAAGDKITETAEKTKEKIAN
jgi:predicted small secreted protein